MNVADKIDRNKLNYRQSTSAVIVDDLGKILLVQKMNWQDNEWDLPGGGVDENETPSEAVIRELSEELGCNYCEILKVSEQIDRYEWSDELINQKIKEGKPPFRGQERNQFLVKMTKGIKILPQKKEIKAVKWIYPREIDKYCVFPYQLNKMKNLLKEFDIRVET
jgi:putative (di)nucleoside polyphosphate hydrolase